MNTRDEYLRQLHSKLDKWNAEIDKLSNHMHDLTASARQEYAKQLQALLAMRDEANNKIIQLQNASGQAWEDMKSGVEFAWEAIEQALKSARSRFKE